MADMETGRSEIDPHAWFADVLVRINDLSVSRLHELLPWNWKTSGQHQNIHAP